MLLPRKRIQPVDEQKSPTKSDKKKLLEIDTVDGKLHIEWNQEASVTPIGQLPFLFNFSN